MPPASPAATCSLRIQSMSVVLPWSTWPRNVTTGARGFSVSGGSSGMRSSASIAFRTGLAASLLRACSIVTLKPYFAATCVAMSGSTRWLMDARIFSPIKSAIRRFGLMLSFAARSLTTTAPRIEISRDSSLTLMLPPTVAAAGVPCGTRFSNAFCASLPLRPFFVPSSSS